MSKFQPAYNQAKKKVVRVMVPEIDEEIRELQDTKRNVTDPDMKKAIDAKIKSLQIKKKSYRKGDPVKEDNVEEEAQGAVTTGSIGVSTMSTSDGGTEPAVYGSSHIHAKHMGTFSRKKGYEPPVHDDGRKKTKKKKKKKTQKEFVEFYFEDQE